MAPRLELYTSVRALLPPSAPTTDAPRQAEPCPMCSAAIVWGRFGRVVFGTSIGFIAAHGGEQIAVPAAAVAAAAPWDTVRVVGGVLANETDPLYARGGGALL